MTFLINIFFWLLSGLLKYQSSTEQSTPLVHLYSPVLIEVHLFFFPFAFCLKPITFVPQQTEKRYIYRSTSKLVYGDWGLGVREKGDQFVRDVRPSLVEPLPGRINQKLSPDP